MKLGITIGEHSRRKYLRASERAKRGREMKALDKELDRGIV